MVMLSVWSTIVPFLTVRDHFVNVCLISKEIYAMSTQPHLLPRKLIMRLDNVPDKSVLDTLATLRSSRFGSTMPCNPLSEVTTLVIALSWYNDFSKIALNFPKLVNLILPIDFDDDDAKELRLPVTVRSICIACHSMTDMSTPFINNPNITVRGKHLPRQPLNVDGDALYHARLTAAIDRLTRLENDEWDRLHDFITWLESDMAHSKEFTQARIDATRERLYEEVIEAETLEGRVLPEVRDEFEQKLRDAEDRFRKEHEEVVMASKEQRGYICKEYFDTHMACLQAIKDILCERPHRRLCD